MLKTCLFLAACLAASPAVAAAAEFDDDLSAGLYLEKHGDPAGAYLRYAAAAPDDPEAAARMAELAALTAARMARTYQVLPFVCAARPRDGVLAAAELQRLLASATAASGLLRTAPLEGAAPASLQGPTGAVRRLPGVNRYIAGEVEKAALTTRTEKLQKLREVKEPFEVTRMVKEEYQEEVDETSETDEEIAKLLGDAAGKEVGKKAGKFAGAAAKIGAKAAAKSALAARRTVTRTREVPVTTTEYRVKYEPYTVAVKRRYVQVSVKYGIIDPADGAPEFARSRTVSAAAQSRGGKEEPDEALVRRALARAAAEMAADLSSEILAAAGRSPARLNAYLAQGKKKEAAEASLMLLAKNRRDPAALQGLKLAAGAGEARPGEKKQAKAAAIKGPAPAAGVEQRAAAAFSELEEAVGLKRKAESSRK